MRKSEFAVINIGSNSVKLYIPSDSRFGTRKVISSQLASGASKDGRLLDADAVSRSFDAVRELQEFARDKAEHIFVYGTEALRRAENGHVLTERIEGELGLTTELIDGKKEALCAVLGARDSFPDKKVFIDIGGASAEAARLYGGGELKSESYPIGAVRLTDEGRGDFLAMKAIAERTVGSMEKYRCPVGLGGTFTALASLSLGLSTYSDAAVHGVVLTRAELYRLQELLSPLSPEEINETYPVLKKPRARVIKAGLAIALTVAERLDAESISVSADDGLKGYIALKKSEEKI